MKRFFTFIALFLIFTTISKSQIFVTSSPGTYDSLFSGIPMYYQHSWDEPLEEIRDTFKLPIALNAFNISWDSAIVSDGSLLLTSFSNPKATLIIDATGWDLMDKGYEDTINYPNISPVMLAETNDEVEWRNFGFAREMDSIGILPSYGSVKIRYAPFNKFQLIYGDFGVIRPDLCFEGFGSLRPSITFIDSNNITHTWFIYGDPENPSFDSLITDSAFDHLPPLGQHITIDLNKTKSIKRSPNIGIKVFPNPATDLLNIQSSINFTGRAYRIISMDGRTVREGKLSTKTLDINNLTPGTYILSLENDDRNYVSRFLKMQ
jgi:hypothetical protein